MNNSLFKSLISDILFMLLGAVLLWGGLIYFFPSALSQNGISVFFLPGQNSISTEEFHGIPIPAFFWLWIFLSAGLNKIKDAIGRKKMTSTATISRPLRMSFLAFLTYLFLQTAGQGSYFFHHQQHKTATSDGQIASYFGKYYFFPQYAKKYLSGRHHCELQGDWVKNNDADSLGYVILLRYFLYPIDISLKKDEPVDCLLLMNEKENLPPVPAGFQPVAQFDEKSLIARKK